MGGQLQGGNVLRWPDHLVLKKVAFDAIWKVTKDWREAKMRGLSGQQAIDYAVAKKQKREARRKNAQVK